MNILREVRVSLGHEGHHASSMTEEEDARRREHDHDLELVYPILRRVILKRGQVYFSSHWRQSAQRHNILSIVIREETRKCNQNEHSQGLIHD